MKLLLFDIDGTLIHTAGAGREAMESAFEKIYGLQNGFHDIIMMGRTDPSILEEALKNHGLEWNDREVRDFREIYFQILESMIKAPKKGKCLCPGIQELLDRLSQHPDITLGLLTGNWKTSSFIKLRHFGIDGYFHVGAYADDSARRDELVPFAIRRVEKLWGKPVRREDITVIGDTPLDVACARPHDVRTVAVATGSHSLKELKPCRPDHLFKNLKNTEEVFLALVNN